MSDVSLGIMAFKLKNGEEILSKVEIVGDGWLLEEPRRIVDRMKIGNQSSHSLEPWIVSIKDDTAIFLSSSDALYYFNEIDIKREFIVMYLYSIGVYIDQRHLGEYVNIIA